MSKNKSYRNPDNFAFLGTIMVDVGPDRLLPTEFFRNCETHGRKIRVSEELAEFISRDRTILTETKVRVSGFAITADLNCDSFLDDVGMRFGAQYFDLFRVASIIDRQPKGERGVLLVDGHTNIFLTRSDSVCKAISAVWCKSGWNIGILPVHYRTKFHKGNRIFVVGDCSKGQRRRKETAEWGAVISNLPKEKPFIDGCVIPEIKLLETL